MDTLQRFVDAQAEVWPAVCDELRAGNKTSHWMWFVFPQLRGLGRSAMAHHYGIASRAEALAYLGHPILGPRLLQGLRLLLAHDARSAASMLGEVDAMKLHSCVTLFAAVDPGQPLFAQALERFFDGRADAATLTLLAALPG